MVSSSPPLDPDPRSPDALREDAAHLAVALAEAHALRARLDTAAGDHIAVTLHHPGGGHDRVMLRRPALRQQITDRIDHLTATHRLLLGEARALEMLGREALRRDIGALGRGLGQGS